MWNWVLNWVAGEPPRLYIDPTMTPARTIAAACLALYSTAQGTPAWSAPADLTSSAQDAASNLLRGNTQQAITLYTEALKDPKLSNDRRGSILNDRAVAYARSGQAKLAIDDFNRAIQLYPEHAATYNNRGNLLLALGLHKEAIRDFDRAILLSPGYAAAHANRAGAFDRLGKPDEALRDYSRAIELIPQSPVPLAGRGRVLLALGRPYAAIRDFSRAANTDARFANAYRGRASAKIRIGRYDEAIEDFSRAIAFDNASAELHVLRGHAYLGVRNHASAIRDFARAIELEPSNTAAYAARGLASGYVEAFDDAFADINRAIESNPKNPVSFAYRAVVYAEAGQTDVGLKDIETALKLEPNRPEALWARGVIAEAQGRTADAIADYRRAADANPELTIAAVALKRTGGALGDTDDVPVAGTPVDGWTVVQRGNAFFATTAEFPGLRVPLESPGSGVPRLIDWEARKPPYKGIGVLRFAGGSVLTKGGPAPVELTAIVDITTRTVIAVEPHKIGPKQASFNWEDGRIIVAGIDGTTDEFSVRTSGTAALAAGGARRPFDGQPGSAIDNALGYGPLGQKPPRPAAVQAKRAPKPKTIFDLLFGN